jgi:DNA-binding beta-propeller fold protein YncE
MKTKMSNVLVVIIILAIASLACQTVMGLVSGDDGAEEIPAPMPEQSSPADEAEPAEDLNEPASEAEQNSPDTDGDEYRSDEGGFSFVPIPDYDIEEFFGMVSMEAPNADSDLGPAFLLVGGLNEEELTSEQLIDNFIEDSTADPDADITVSNRTSVNVGGIDGLMVELGGTVDDQEVAGRVVVAMPTPMQQFTMFGYSPADQWDEFGPHFEAVMASVAFFAPSQIEFDFEMDEDAETEDGAEMAAELDTEETRQWASEAAASSEWGSTGWAAYQATGEPDTLIDECEDATTAWASAGSDTVEWIELTYETAVVPTEIHIIQTYMPDQVVMVEVVDLQGDSTTVYTAEPEDMGYDVCPYTLTVPVDVDVEVKAIKITIDQSLLEYWNEIDAVELVGYLPGTEGPAEPSVPEGSTTEGVLWRFGGENGSEKDYGNVHGVDATADGLLYITDETYGVWVLNAEDGSQVDLISHEDLWAPSDVEIGPDGNIFVADWGTNKVFKFSPDGELLTKFGGDGNGPGQFGTFSPDFLAISPAGEIFTFDENENDAGEEFDRVQVFDADGKFLREFPIETDEPEIEDMAIGPDGNLYLVEWFDDILLKFSPDGELLGQVGEDALYWAGPRKIDIDDAGNFYLATWGGDNIVMKLDPQGNLIAQFGVDIDDGESFWPEGSFYSVSGIAVSPDGSRVFVSDWSSTYSFVTAFEFK